MDSFAQAAAYLQPSLEFIAKLSSIIPVWMMMVMADKHFLGLPLLEGSVWYSPRIPPRFTISSGRGGEHASGSKFGRHAATFGPSPLGCDIPGSTIPYPRPFQAQPRGASTSTALTLHQTLEAHDPFFSSSGWLEHGYIGSAALLVVVISFVAMITSGRGYLFGKSQTSQARNTSNTQTPLFAHEQLTEEVEFPTCWESILEDILSDHSDETLEDSIDQPIAPIRANEDESSSPPNMIADTAEKENPEEEIPETHNEDNGQEGKTETNGADATTTGGKPENYAEAGNENGSEAGKAAGKEYSKEGSKVDNKEDGPGEPGNIEELEISTMGEGIKKKKRRVRQNAKRRAAKFAAAEEAGKEVGDASNALLEGPTQREDKDGKPEKLEPKVVKPEASDALASARSQKQDEVAGKEIGDPSKAFPEGPKQRKGKGGKSKDIEREVVEPEASHALTTAKGQEAKATAKDTTTTGKGGGYSFKEADLHDAIFVADTAKKTPLPPRPPTPQPTKKPVPAGLPSKSQFTGLSTPKSSGTPQPSPAATAKSSPGSDLLASLITRPKGSVPPLMPHHKSFGAAQSSSNGPSGQFSTPFQNIPGLNVPTTVPAPNHIPFKSGAVDPSPDGPKPLFTNLPPQGGPKAGTDPRPKNAYFENGYPNAPIFRSLPSGHSSNDAFKLPAVGPSAGSGQSSAGPAKTAPTNQSIFQNVPTSSGQFTGFGSPSVGSAKTIPSSQSIFQNMSRACPVKTTPPAKSIFQNAFIPSGQFMGPGNSNAGLAKTTPPKQSIAQNGSISSGQFTGFSQSSAGPTMTTPPSQSVYQNVSSSSKPFMGFASSSASPPKTIPPSQSISKDVSVPSVQSTGFGSSSTATTNPPIAHPGSMYQKIAQPPTPLSLGINQQRGMMPLQNAVTGAMKIVAENKMERTKPTAGPGASPFKPRPMPKGRLGLSKPERPWPSARQGDGASYWRTGESVAWPHARQMNGKPFWR